MKNIVACAVFLSLLAALSGCATTAPEPAAAEPNATTATVQEVEYGTGTNIAKRKNKSANIVAMSPEQAEEMRRSLQSQQTGGGGK
jgi:ABC-type Fe3+-hydroxamate transport system substrate-binding protein